MSCYEKLSVLTNIFIAIGTISSVFTAVYLEKIKSCIFKTKLSIEILDYKGELTQWANGSRVYYYHIVFKNLKPGRTIRKCSVFLKKIQKLNANGEFIDLPITVPPRFIWAPSETSPEAIDIISEQVLDFGVIEEPIKDVVISKFYPVVTKQFFDFKGNTCKNETLRYHLDIISENYKQKKLTIIEVTWNGKWSENTVEMMNNLKIRKI